MGSITVGLANVVAPGETIGIDLQPAFEVSSAYTLPFPDDSFDAAFAHTLLLHLGEPLRALGEMKRVLKAGGVVGIADPEHGAMLREPHVPLVDEAHRLLMRVVAHHGSDNFRARHHRRLLRDAGFARLVVGATLETVGVWATAEETRLFGAWEAGQLLQPETVALVTEQGWADETRLKATHSALVAWGNHPDAMLAIIGVTAVGWVDG